MKKCKLLIIKRYDSTVYHKLKRTPYSTVDIFDCPSHESEIDAFLAQGYEVKQVCYDTSTGNVLVYMEKTVSR